MVTLAHFYPSSSTAPSTSSSFYVACTHWDDRGPMSRTESAKLILAKIDELVPRGKLVVLLGDLNFPSGEKGYQILTGRRYLSNATTAEKDGGKLTTFRDARHELSLAKPHSSTPGSPLLHSYVSFDHFYLVKKANLTTEGSHRRPFGDLNTFTGFASTDTAKIIDFVLYLDNGVVSEKGGWRVSRYGVMPNHFHDGEGRMLASDHRLVVASFEKVG
jgi:hypothetical protein